MKGHRIFVIMALCIVLAVPLSATAETWKPAKPIKLIVPWGAGGSTDQVTRVCAGELEAALGQKIVVVNQPGASGSIGTKNTLDAPRDGYTWTSGAAKDLGTYQVLGMIDTNIRDWKLRFPLPASIRPVIPESKRSKSIPEFPTSTSPMMAEIRP
jgi:tripartite-type tricarboxylate transporter receptor subunit TctC